MNNLKLRNYDKEVKYYHADNNIFTYDDYKRVIEEDQ